MSLAFSMSFVKINRTFAEPRDFFEPTKNATFENIIHPDAHLFSNQLYKYSLYVHQIFGTIILIVGTFGNWMTVIVARGSGCLRSSPDGSLGIYLTVLAVSESCLLYTGLLSLWWRAVFGYKLFDLHWLACKFRMWGMYSSGVLSSWILVSMTTQRAVAVTWPHRAKTLFTLRRCRNILFALVILIVLLHSHMLYGFDLVRVYNGTVVECARKSEDYGRFMDSIWSWIDMCTFSFLPSLLLIISNAVLIRKVVASLTEARRKFLPIVSGQMKVRERKTVTVAATLVVVSIIFVVLSLPYSVYHPVTFYRGVTSSAYDVNLEALKLLILSFMDVTWYANSAVNFYIYCLTGSKFRAEFLNIVLRAMQSLKYPIYLLFPFQRFVSPKVIKDKQLGFV